MNSALSTGLTHVQSLEMQDRLIVSANAPEESNAGPACATAFVAGLMEWACIEALRPYLGEGEYTVGSHLYLSHAAPAPVSSKLIAIAELVEMKGTTLRFRVDCFDECDQIGGGFHERTLVAPPQARPETGARPASSAEFQRFR
jgi:fluoroacetyl-CoA thioesterase